MFSDPKIAEPETEISTEWEIKTITSALKTYLRYGKKKKHYAGKY